MIRTARLTSGVLAAALMVAGLVAAPSALAEPRKDLARSADRKPPASAMGLLRDAKKVPAPKSIARANKTAAADVFVTSPAAAWAPDGSAFVIAQSVGEDQATLNGELDVRFWFDGSGWTDWLTLDKPTTAGLSSAPTATWSADGNRVDFFAAGTDQHLYQTWIDFTQNDAAPWVDRSGALASAPSASWVGNNRVDIFVIGSDFRLYQKAWTAAEGWTDWIGYDGPAVGNGSAPAITWANGGRLDVFVTGQDGQAYQKAWTATGGWTGWLERGGALKSAPTASWTLNGRRIDVFGLGADTRLNQKAWDASFGWTDWLGYAPPAVGAAFTPSASWTANGQRIDVVILGDTDGHIYQKAWDPTSGWTDWIDRTI
jgi:hypothetical protein